MRNLYAIQSGKINFKHFRLRSIVPAGRAYYLAFLLKKGGRGENGKRKTLLFFMGDAMAKRVRSRVEIGTWQAYIELG